MNENKLKLLNYISKNYDTVVKPAKGGEYIEIDVLPSSGEYDIHDLHDFSVGCEKMNIDYKMFTRHGYTKKIGDGIRECRYFYFMQETTKEILEDLKKMPS